MRLVTTHGVHLAQGCCEETCIRDTSCSFSLQYYRAVGRMKGRLVGKGVKPPMEDLLLVRVEGKEHYDSQVFS